MKNEKRVIELYTWDYVENSIILAGKFYSTINDVMSQLPKNTFLQSERSYIINLSYVERIDKNYLVLKNQETRIPISRLRKRAIKAACKAFIAA